MGVSVSFFFSFRCERQFSILETDRTAGAHTWGKEGKQQLVSLQPNRRSSQITSGCKQHWPAPQQQHSLSTKGQHTVWTHGPPHLSMVLDGMRSLAGCWQKHCARTRSRSDQSQMKKTNKYDRRLLVTARAPKYSAVEESVLHRECTFYCSAAWSFTFVSFH